MAQGLHHRRLAWLAMRDYCEKQANQRSAMGWLGLALTRGSAGRAVSSRGDANRMVGSDKMMDYSIAVDLCADRLTVADQQALRASGQLPEWFVPAVEQEFAALRAKR